MRVKRLICTLIATLTLCSGAIYQMATPALAVNLLNVTDTLSNYSAGNTADHTIAFTTSSDIPQNGKIMIEFPAGFDISGVALGTLMVNGANVSFSLQPPSGQTVIVNQTGNSPVLAGSNFSLQLTGIVNTQTTGTYHVTVTTTAANTKNTIDGPTDSADFVINSGAAAALQVAGYPSSVSTGESHTFDVTALDAFNNIDISYNGTVHFTSTDPAAGLPPDYTFVSSDNGSHTFSATFNTAGTQSITATDTVSANLTGTQSGITVSPVFTIVTNSPLPDGTFGMNYAPVSLHASGGVPPYTWSLQNGNLPAGLSLSPGGIISGTPSTAGGLNVFTVQVTDNATVPNIAAKDFSLPIDAAPTSITLISSSPSSAFGQSVTFTASVTSTAGIPTGTVTFYDGPTLLGNATLDSSGSAAFSTGSLSTGNHSITGVYSGDANFATSTSTPLTQSVGLAATSTGLASSSNPSAYGQSVTFTATVTSTAGIPTGTVSFYDGSTLLGTATLDSSGSAAFSTGSLSTGNHSITGVYSGDTNFTASTSTTLTQSVGPASTSTGLASSLNPSALGQSVTFTASVTSTAGIPTGTVTFYDGPTLLGNATLDSSGTAAFSTGSLSTGNHSITGVYSGDTSFASSTSTPLTQSVGLAATSTGLASSSNPSAYGQSVTFTASVTSTAGIPTGTISFYDGSTLLGTATLDSSGSAAFSTGSLSTGNHSITAVYSGDTNFASSTSTPLTQSVGPASTSTGLESSLNPSTYGQSVTFTASVTSTAGTPTGKINFYDGPTLLGSATLDSSGTAVFSIATLPAGNHSIDAVYQGDTNFASSTSTPLTQSVGLAATSTGLVSSQNPSTYGQSVTFTATITSSAGTPTGSVNFYDGSSLLGTGSLDPSGTASLSTSLLSTGSHSITAVYSGDTNFATSTSSALTQSVGLASTLTGLTSSLNPSTYGQSVTFTASVTSTAGIPTGRVNFYDSSTLLGNATLDSSGSAAFSTGSLSTGNHSITGVYSGDTNFAPSTSTPLTQSVGPASTSTGLASSLNPSALGQSVTFTATVTSTAGIPTGTVNFYDGSTLLGNATLDSSGSAAVSTGSLSTGNHSVTAVYNGDTNFASSTSSPVSQSVGLTSTATGVASSLNPSTYGQSVTFTASVTSTAGIPTGTVNFYDGSNLLGNATLDSSGMASFSIATLPAGNHSIDAVYEGDANFASSTSSPVSQSVGQAVVTPAVTVSDKTYDGSDSATINGRSLTGVIGGDNVNLTGGSATFVTPDAGTGITVNIFGLTLSGNAAANYVLSSSAASTTANISAKNLTVSGIIASDKVYDGTTAAVINTGNASLNGVVAGDSINLDVSLASGTFADPNAGTGKLVNIAGLSISGVGVANYVLIQPTTTANISKAMPLISWANPADIVYPAALGPGQLDATASVPGQFTYTPPAGTVLSAGAGQDLHVDFIPTDNLNYNDASADVTINVNTSPTTTPTGGGGGGGGGGLGGLGGSSSGGGGGASSDSSRTYLSQYMTGTAGVFSQDFSTKAYDGICNLFIPKGTTAKTAEGWALSYITFDPVPADKQTLPPPPGGNIIGLTYSLGPEGTTFNPPVTMYMYYFPDKLPAGTKETDLVIGYWDSASQQWVALSGCLVDTVKHTVTASISHFSTYALLSIPPAQPAAPSTPAFTVSNLTVSPAEATAGQPVTVSALVTNQGGTAADFTANLEINDQLEDSRSVNVAGNASQTVSFVTTPGTAGTYSVKINDLGASLTVNPPQAPPVTPGTQTAEPAPSSSPPAPAPTLSPATFALEDLKLSPSHVAPGAEADISVTVTNKGDANGDYTLNLKINGNITDTRQVTVAGQSSEEVNFKVSQSQSGKYNVDINGLSGVLAVSSPRPGWLIPVGIVLAAFIFIFTLWFILRRASAGHI